LTSLSALSALHFFGQPVTQSHFARGANPLLPPVQILDSNFDALVTPAYIRHVTPPQTIPIALSLHFRCHWRGDK
jgi:hypothetical protein